jgi:hypothetical protein
LRQHVGLFVVGRAGFAGSRELHWERCRNSLGIARLLLHEGRPAPLVATACQVATEAACRAALEHRGAAFDGDVARALDQLAAPAWLSEGEARTAADGLAAAEKIVGWVAEYLRSAAPGRNWGY